MVEPVTKRDFSKGSNNRAHASALPPGFTRESLNFDHPPGGQLALRAGYEEAYAGTAVHGVLALGHRLLIADGAALIELDTNTNSTRALRAIPAVGGLAGAVLNGELFFCTADEALRYDGSTVREWGVPVPPPIAQPTVAATGALLRGAYQYTATFINAQGEEGGAVYADLFTVGTEGSAATFTLPEPPAGGRVRLYLSTVDGTTMYAAGERTTAGTLHVTAAPGDDAPLGTEFAKPPPVGTLVTAYNGVLLVAAGSTVWVTSPLQPHLTYPSRAFFEYPAPVSVLQAVAAGVYVGADTVYWLTGADTIQPTQVPIQGAIAPVPGTGASTRDGRAAWMTQYGPVLGDAAGRVEFLTRDNYVPTVASRGASGAVEHNGASMVVTTMRGIPQKNSLQAGDFFDAEIIYP